MEPEAQETKIQEEVQEKTPEQMLSEASDKGFEKISENNILGKEPLTPPPAQSKSETEPDDKVAADKGDGKDALDEQTLRDIREGKIIPKHRLDQVLERMKLYESFGTPEELAKLIRSGSAKITPKEEPAKPEELTEEEKAAKSVFDKMYPHLKDLPKTVEMIQKFKENMDMQAQFQREANQAIHDERITAGTDEIKKLCDAAGLSTEDRNLQLHIGAVTQLMHMDKKLSDKFYLEGDIKVLKTVFDDYFKAQFSGFQRQAKVKILQDGKTTARLPRAPIKSGAAPADNPDQPPKSFEDAGNAAWDKFNAA